MLKSVYKGGSGLVLPNPHDEDYFYYYTTNKERVKAVENNTDHSVDKHFKLWKNRTRITIFCYVYPLMEYVSGEVIEDFKMFNICDHKQEYKEVAMTFIGYAQDTFKSWYHIYIACCMFENGGNFITDEQKQTAQKVHDNGIDEITKSYCLNQLDLIK